MIGANSIATAAALEIRVHVSSFATCFDSFVLVKRHKAFEYVHYHGLCEFKVVDESHTM